MGFDDARWRVTSSFFTIVRRSVAESRRKSVPTLTANSSRDYDRVLSRVSDIDCVCHICALRCLCRQFDLKVDGMCGDMVSSTF